MAKKGPVVYGKDAKRKKKKQKPTVIVGRDAKEDIPYSIALQKQISFFISRFNLRCGIRVFEAVAPWGEMCIGHKLSEEMMRTFPDRLDWLAVSCYQNLSEPFMTDFMDRLSIDSISRNQRMSKQFVYDHRKTLNLSIIYERGIVIPAEINQMEKEDKSITRFHLLDIRKE